jgi:hypothetical protein
VFQAFTAPRLPTLTRHSTPVDTNPIITLPITEAASTETSPRFRSTTSPLDPRTLLRLEDTLIWREDQALSLRCRKCKRLSLASHFIIRELTTPMAPSTVKGTRFTTGVNHTFGTIERHSQTVTVTALVVITRQLPYIRFPLVLPLLSKLHYPTTSLSLARP